MDTILYFILLYKIIFYILTYFIIIIYGTIKIQCTVTCHKGPNTDHFLNLHYCLYYFGWSDYPFNWVLFFFCTYKHYTIRLWLLSYILKHTFLWLCHIHGGKMSVVEVFSLYNQSVLSTNTDSGTFVFLIFITAIPFGPTIYVYLCLICYIILFFYPTPASNEPSHVGLHPETCVGCPNGLCYLHMFKAHTISK